MGSARKILIVDDNVDAADLTAEILRINGLDVDVAYGGLAGVAAARQCTPAVIFLDLGMPEMDGYEVARTLRSDEAFRDVKIVALTAWGDELSRVRSREAGFDLHLTKPASFVTLMQIAQ